MKTQSSLTALLLGAGLALASLSADAATAWTRNLVTGANTGGAPTATVDGYADNNGSGNVALVSSPAPNWSGGYGVCSSSDGDCGQPTHAMDNVGNRESLLLSFSDVVALTSVTIGYKSGDADISVLAYTGSGDAEASLTSHSYSTLTTSGGWSLIGNYANLAVNTAMTVNTGAVSSSYWLIAAYNTTFSSGGCTGANGAPSSYCTGNGDYMKVLAVAGTQSDNPPPPQVPEPGSLVLVALPLLGLLVSRRRRA